MTTALVAADGTPVLGADDPDEGGTGVIPATRRGVIPPQPGHSGLA